MRRVQLIKFNCQSANIFGFFRLHRHRMRGAQKGNHKFLRLASTDKVRECDALHCVIMQKCHKPGRVCKKRPAKHFVNSPNNKPLIIAYFATRWTQRQRRASVLIKFMITNNYANCVRCTSDKQSARRTSVKGILALKFQSTSTL